MGLFGGGILVLLSAVTVGFTIAVHKSEKVNQFYESHVKEWLDWSEFLVTWVDAMSYVFAMVMFKFVKKWDVVFFDCFTPSSIWLDSGYTSFMLIQLVYFIGDYSKSYAKIAVEWMGLGVQMASIFSYVMLKSALDPSFQPKKADRQNLWALIFFGLSGFILIMALNAEGEIVAPPGQGFGSIAMIVAAAAMGFQLLQIYCAIYFRCKEENFNDDAPDIAMVKLTAAVVKVLTQCYYCWLYTSKGYWNSIEKMPLALMTSFTLGCYVLVAFERFVGPSWLKSVSDRIVSETRATYHRAVTGFHAKVAEFRDWITRTSAAIEQRWIEQCDFWRDWWDRKTTELAQLRSDIDEAVTRMRTTVSDFCKRSIDRLTGREVAAAQVGGEEGSV